jgi:hypothetical protein
MPTDFNQITFDNKNHTYRLGSQVLLSVTSLIDRLKPIFDKEGISAKLAEREGRSQAEILKEWEKSGEESRDKGTRVHAYIEDVLDDKIDPTLRLINDRVPEMDAFDEAWKRMKKALNIKIIEKEKIVGDSDYGVAGRTDAILEFAGKPCIFDWKTGKKFDESNPYERMLAPFDGEDNCHLNAYSIQVSLYRLMIERNCNYQMGDPYLLHLRPNGTFHLYRAKDYRAKLESWLKNGLPEEFTSDPKAEDAAKFVIKKIEALIECLPKLSQKTSRELTRTSATLLKTLQTVKSDATSN